MIANGASEAWLRTATNHKLLLGSNSGWSLALDTAGNVGIGTSSPAYKLDVSGTGRFTSNLTVALDLDAGGGALFVDQSQGTVGIGTVGQSTVELDVYGDHASSVAALFQNDGNNNNRYGISIAAGLDTPNGSGQETEWVTLLDGNGDQEGGIGLFDGHPDIYFVSDPRVKTDIAPTKVAGLAVIDAIELIEYRRKYNEGTIGGLVPIGFSAENVASEFPAASGHLPGRDTKIVAPGKFIPVLIKAVQELSTEVQDARSENARLASDVAALKSLVCITHSQAAVCTKP